MVQEAAWENCGEPEPGVRICLIYSGNPVEWISAKWEYKFFHKFVFLFLMYKNFN